MEVSDAELGALDVHRQVDLASSGKILDVAISAVFRAARDRSGAFLADFFFDRVFCAAGMDVDGLRWLGNYSVHSIGGYQFSFTSVPFREHLRRGCAAQDSWVD